VLSTPASHAITHPERLAALRRTGLLDTPTDEAFDRLTRLATAVLRAPVAMLALVDGGRDFVKSGVGLPAPLVPGRELRLTPSLCHRVVETGEPLVIEDVRAHPEFGSFPAVAIGLGAYLGVPLVTSDGYAIGTFCVADVAPRRWSDADVAVLRDLAGAVMTEVELRARATEQERAERLLRESTQQFAQAFHQTSVGTAIVAPDGRLLDVNDALCALLGYERGELLGVTLRRLTHPDDVDASEAVRRGLLAGTASGRQIEKRYLHRDGRSVWALASVTLVRDALGRPAQFIVQMQDITDRREVERALRESEEKYRSAVDGTRDVIFRLDAEGRWAFLNAAWTELTGYGAAESLGGSFLERVHPDDRSALAEALRPVLDGEQEYCQHQARYLTSAGAVRWVDVHARAPRRPHDESADGAATHAAPAERAPAGAAGTLTDVTERKQLEEQLRQAQKMEAVGRLAGGVAHDFNNLLTAIKGYGGLLMEALHPSDVRRADVQEINKAADRAAALTRQLLAFSRKQVLKPVVLDLNDVVADMESMLRRLIGEDVRLATGLASDLGAVRADRGQLEQVLMNLVINARDAMSGGGALTVETANVDVRRRFVDRQLSVDPGHYVMLAVKDSGCGMDEETQQHIFEPFFTTKGVGGTGLGLATVYGIVRQSGGFVRVASAPGVGTTIAVHLPRTTDAPAAGERVPSPAPTLDGRGTVLLCEDESAVRALARRVLEGQGYTVIEAAHGAAALAVAAAHAAEIALLVTDVVMPEMGGRELAEQLTAARPGLRVLYMSGYTDGDILRRGLAREGRAFLQKPFTPEDLARKVQAVLTASPASHVSG